MSCLELGYFLNYHGHTKWIHEKLVDALGWVVKFISPLYIFLKMLSKLDIP